MKKKGLSPIIATVLLIAIAIILAIIIFLWARSFVSEQVQKFEDPIEDACNDVNFDVEVSVESNEAVKARVLNRGNVPIYGVEVSIIETFGSVEAVGTTRKTISNGESADFELEFEGEEINEGNEVLVTPVILGETGSGVKRAYPCDDDYGVSTKVK